MQVKDLQPGQEFQTLEAPHVLELRQETRTFGGMNQRLARVISRDPLSLPIQMDKTMWLFDFTGVRLVERQKHP